MTDQNKTALLSKLRAEGVQAGDERAQHGNWYSRTHMHEYSRDATWRGWQARAALASAPVAGEAQPTDADITRTITTLMEQARYARHAVDGEMGVRVQDVMIARAVLARYGHTPLPVADAAPQASEAVCSCPTGDGSLRHPCAVHPPGDKDGGDCAKGAGDAKAWIDLFWSVAKELNCLPSSFVDGNEHVLRAARKARAALSPTQPTEQGERDAG